MAWDWEEAQGLIGALVEKGGLTLSEVRLLVRLCSPPFLRSGRAHIAVGVVQAKIFLKHLCPLGFSKLLELAEASDPGEKSSSCQLAAHILEQDHVDISRLRVFGAEWPRSREAPPGLETVICPKDEWCGATLRTMLALYKSVDSVLAATDRGSAGTPVLFLRPCFVRVKPSLRGLLSR